MLPPPCVVFALLFGIVAGLRTFTAPAALSWAAWLGILDISATSLAFLGYRWTPWILTVCGLGELVGDQLPSTPSRTVPMQFGARLVSGALCGAALGVAHGVLVMCTLAGVVGAIVGTLGGRACRGWLAGRFGKDRPAAFIEDAIAIGGAALLVVGLR